MNPCYFGAPEAPLFGMYNPPRVSVAREGAVLLCPPIGLEYLRTHYALRLLALQLAESGLHVLRFDYHGTGDSSGEIGPGQFGVWVEDVALAAQELSEISGAQSVTVVGLRAGALLAMEALARYRPAADGLVLWDPVVDGTSYLESLESMNGQLVAVRPTGSADGDELLGASYPTDLRAALRAVDLTNRVQAAAVTGAALVVSEERPEYDTLRSRMQQVWPETQYRLIADSVQWESLKAAFDARMTGPIVRAVAEAAEALT